jgi:hypothetical protein
MLSLFAGLALAEEKEGPGFEYVVFISRDPAWRQFECKRVAPDTGFVTDPDVAGYYPYHLSRGDRHYAVVAPTQCMPIFWLSVEQRYKGWLEEAAGSLQMCEQLLVDMERQLQQRRDYERARAKHEREWQEALQRAKLRYLQRAKLSIKAEELDVMKLWGELTRRRDELLGREKEAPAQAPAEKKEEKEPEAVGRRPEAPAPEYFRAESTPNNNGMHVTLIWPAVEFAHPESAPKEKPKEPAPAPPPPPPQKKALSAGEQSELKAINAKLEALGEAHRYASFLQDSRAKLEEFQKQLVAMRGAYLSRVAAFSTLLETLDCESRAHLGAVLNIDPGKLTPETVEAAVPALENRLAEARGRAFSKDATAYDYDRFDALNYAVQLARAYVERAEKKVSLAPIENDLLWQLAARLKEAGLAETAPGGAPRRAEPSQLLAALSKHREAGLRSELDTPAQAKADWEAVQKGFDEASGNFMQAKLDELKARVRERRLTEPGERYYRSELSRVSLLAAAAVDRLKGIERLHAGRRYFFRLAAAPVGGPPEKRFEFVASASPRPGLFDVSMLTNFVFALVFTGIVLAVMAYVRRNPHVFIRRIAGLEALDEAIGRATEMGKPVLFVHGLSTVGDIAVLASLSILGRIARRVAEYDSDLLVANNDPLVYSVSYEVVQEGYKEAGRPDTFKPDNIIMAASEQFPYVAAVAGIMSRRSPAANFFVGYFYAEALILAESGAATGAIQIAATDSFTQLPFFITTCDYTLMGEELYAAGAYLSREPRMLATIKAQDIGKSVLLALLPLGTFLGTAGWRMLQVLFTAYEKGG